MLATDATPAAAEPYTSAIGTTANRYSTPRPRAGTRGSSSAMTAVIAPTSTALGSAALSQRGIDGVTPSSSSHRRASCRASGSLPPAAANRHGRSSHRWRSSRAPPANGRCCRSTKPALCGRRLQPEFAAPMTDQAEPRREFGQHTTALPPRGKAVAPTLRRTTVAMDEYEQRRRAEPGAAITPLCDTRAAASCGRPRPQSLPPSP
jgi:hypothetical protein